MNKRERKERRGNKPQAGLYVSDATEHCCSDPLVGAVVKALANRLGA